MIDPLLRPWLLGWALGLVSVLLCVGLLNGLGGADTSRRRGRWLGLGMVLVPVALGLSWKLPRLLAARAIELPSGGDVLLAALSSLLIYGGAALAGELLARWLQDLGQENLELRKLASRPTPPSPVRVKDALAPAWQPGFVPPPPIRPAAGNLGSAAPQGDQVEAAAHNATLLLVLEDGPEAQRQPAARALSIPYADSGDRRVVAALAALVQREDVGAPARAEAYLSLRIVLGEQTPWEQEVELRQRFPAGVDWSWLHEQEAAACEPETKDP